MKINFEKVGNWFASYLVGILFVVIGIRNCSTEFRLSESDMTNTWSLLYTICIWVYAKYCLNKMPEKDTKDFKSNKFFFGFIAILVTLVIAKRITPTYIELLHINTYGFTLIITGFTSFMLYHSFIE